MRPPAAGPGPTARPGPVGVGPARRSGRPGQARAAARHQGVPQPLAQVALDLELAGHVGLRGAELARMPHQPAQGLRRPKHQHGCAVRARLAAVPGPDPDRRVTPEERSAAGSGRTAAPAWGRAQVADLVMPPPRVASQRSARRPGSRSEPASAYPRYKCHIRLNASSKPSRASSSSRARATGPPKPQRLRVVRAEAPAAATRSRVCAGTMASIEVTEGIKPPGKMYFMIHAQVCGWPASGRGASSSPAGRPGRPG